MSVAAGATFNYSTENLYLAISGNTGYTNTITKNRIIKNETDTLQFPSKENSIQSSKYIAGCVGMDVDLSYTISEHLFLNSKFLLSQPFASTGNRNKHFWNLTDVTFAFTLNAPVTSYLSFCYNANIAFNNSRKRNFQFDQSLSAGLYFNLKSPA
jgi:hypothetical protein